jgi:predicted nucleic acid-binding protein
MRCMPTSMQTVQEAWLLFRAHKLSWFDALIVQSALDAKCSHLFTEDMQNGRKFSGLEVVNPFA